MPRKPVATLHIIPDLPEELAPLWDLVHNLWWTWNQDAPRVLKQIDAAQWTASARNPLRFLSSLDRQHLVQLAGDQRLAQMVRMIVSQFEFYLARPTWYAESGHDADLQVAYFSAEFGLSESLRIYSGGLGILAGDHLKAASDLGVPMCGVGLLYRQGYFHQVIRSDGQQEERYPQNALEYLPVTPAADASGTPLVIEVPYPHGSVRARVWLCAVGRVPLYLLDTDVDGNSPEDRDITARLYEPEPRKRIRQEILLGIGGLRALMALGIHPTVCHMNEGHSAFLGLERIRTLMTTRGLSFAAAREAAAAGNVFTTHTPVPAGNEEFPAELVREHLEPLRAELGLSADELLALGRANPQNHHSGFSMTVLALRLSAHANGVSRLHGRVSRRMWSCLWPQLDTDEVPISSITNGVHLQSWASLEMADLFDRYLGPGWRDPHRNGHVWERVRQIPDEELWAIHQQRRQRLVYHARRHLREQLGAQNVSPARVELSLRELNPQALTIGFARRFTDYKRPYLLFRRVERLAALFREASRPLQILFSGKAHPHDEEGKRRIREIVAFTQQEPFAGRVFFLQDYDMNVARYLVQGCDVWLNTPRRPLEASGTSGMKAALNGGLNVSVVDGWWDEAWTLIPGWTIGRGEEYDDSGYQDDVDAAALCDLLEYEVVPLFYQRDAAGLPRGWLQRMKQTIAAVAPAFNTDRMVREYVERAYLPNHRRCRRLQADPERCTRLAEWLARVARSWPQVRVQAATEVPRTALKVGRQVPVQASVELGELSPEDVRVELYAGRLNAQHEIEGAQTQPLAHVAAVGDGRHLYRGSYDCDSPGTHGFTVRVVACHADAGDPARLGFVRWAEPR